MNSEILRNYQLLSTQYQSDFNVKKQQLRLISLARLVCFIGIFLAIYYLNPINKMLAFGLAILFLAAFLFLIKKYIQTEMKVLFFERLIQINSDEIKAIHRDFNPFDPGNEFTDPHHDYSYDLDLYGIGSLFQFLNRTVTRKGKIQLSTLLNQSQRKVDKITSLQSAIQELSGEITWRQHFQAKGKESEDLKSQSPIEESIRQAVHLKSVKTIKLLLNTLPWLTILLTALNIFGVFPNPLYLLAIFSQWIVFIVYSKTISKFQKQFENQGKLLSRYADMLKWMESKQFRSAFLVLLKEKLSSQGKTASIITSELQQILNEFDYRQNLLVGFVLNSFLLWDLRCLSKLHRWQQNYEGDLPRWFDVIAEMDALISLANCNYNHPEWITPEVQDSGVCLNSVGLGHPLIDESKCVRNSFLITGDEQIAIITGANMAGKSTFLRTVGINLILAANGSKVCAENFKFSPVRIFTNMRTTDNLMNDESYFYAELLRLQAMLNILRKGEKLFVIVDEMLKGTNSTDKLNGSKELIHQLISLKTHGIVATHDLGLTELAEKYPKRIKNQCFEVQLLADELKFDYKLTDGVTRTMNATFLMKKMGIIPKD